jgi:hypothetical protein
MFFTTEYKNSNSIAASAGETKKKTKQIIKKQKKKEKEAILQFTQFAESLVN